MQIFRDYGRLHCAGGVQLVGSIRTRCGSFILMDVGDARIFQMAYALPSVEVRCDALLLFSLALLLVERGQLPFALIEKLAREGVSKTKRDGLNEPGMIEMGKITA